MSERLERRGGQGVTALLGHCLDQLKAVVELQHPSVFALVFHGRNEDCIAPVF